MPLPPQNNSNKKSGSGFTNLNKYLQANQANRLGQTVSAGVQRAGGDARNSLTQANQEFQAKAADEQARLAQQGSKVNTVLGGDIAKATDEDVKAFENIRNAESRGPMGVQDANALRSKAGEAEMLGRAGGTEAGRFGLLQRYVGGGKPQYNAGNQRLDQMLLGQTGQQQLRGARSSTYGLGNQAEQTITGAQARGEELKGNARQLAESTIGRLGEQVTGYDTAMQQKLADKKAMVQSILSGVETGDNADTFLDEKMLNQLKEASGGVLDEGKQLYNADLSDYLDINDLYATKQGVQSKDDLDKAKKIAALSGNSLAGKDIATILQDYVGREDLAGSFDANNPFKVTDSTKLNDAINKAKSDYERVSGAEKGQMAVIMRALADAEEGVYSQTGGKIGNYYHYGLQNANTRYEQLKNRKDELLRSSGESVPSQLREVQQQMDALQPNINQMQSDVNAFRQKMYAQSAPTTDRFTGGSAYLNSLLAPDQMQRLVDSGQFTDDFRKIKENEEQQAKTNKEFKTLRTLKKRVPPTV